MIQLAEKTFWEEKRHVWSCGKNTLKTQLSPWKKRTGADHWFEASRGKTWRLQWLAVVWVPRFCKRCGKGPAGKVSGLAWTHGTVCVLERSAVQALCLCGNAQGVCADWSTPEGEAGPSGGQSPDSGDMWRQGCPESPEWISSCSASETPLGCEVYEHINEFAATEVVGQDRSGEVVALFLED